MVVWNSPPTFIAMDKDWFFYGSFHICFNNRVLSLIYNFFGIELFLLFFQFFKTFIPLNSDNSK